LGKLNTTTSNLTRGVTFKQAAATSTFLAIHRNRSRVDDIAIGYGLVGPGFDFSPKRPDRLWGGHSTCCSMGTGVLSLTKLSGSEVNHSPSSGAEVKNEWNYTSTHGGEPEKFNLPIHWRQMI